MEAFVNYLYLQALDFTPVNFITRGVRHSKLGSRAPVGNELVRASPPYPHKSVLIRDLVAIAARLKDETLFALAIHKFRACFDGSDKKQAILEAVGDLFDDSAGYDAPEDDVLREMVAVLVLKYNLMTDTDVADRIRRLLLVNKTFHRVFFATDFKLKALIAQNWNAG